MDSFAACAIDETRKSMPASNHRMCSRALAREATWRRRQNILSGQITSVAVESSWEGLLGLRVHVILFWLLADVCRQCLDCFLFCPICGRALFCAIFAASNCSVLFVVCSIQHLLLSEFYFGIRRVLFWQLQSPMLALAALHSGVHTRRI